MSTAYIAFNFFSAFIIGAGAALTIALLGGAPNKWQIVGIVSTGLVVAAKDTRSLLKLPPVTPSNGNTDFVTKSKDQ